VFQTYNTWGFAFNQTKKPFDNVAVRSAFSAAFDREGYIRDVLKGNGVPYTRSFSRVGVRTIRTRKTG
jgi:ABC-type oligopeptide transport system substrate-binding subunit